MNYWIAVGVLILDALVFFAPLGAIFIVYVLCFKPKWVFKYMKKLYGEA